MIAMRLNTPQDVDRLYTIWERAVAATHDFLNPTDHDAIAPQVHDYVRDAELTVATADGRPVAFMGVTGNSINSLFIDPDWHGQGIGRQLVDSVGQPSTVDVNEQNQAAVDFYQHLGFEVIGRSEVDDQGRPYPVLHLRRS